MGLESVISTPVAPPPPPKAATPPASSSSSSSAGSSSGPSSAQHASSAPKSGSSGAANGSSSSNTANRSAAKSPVHSGNSASNRSATSNTQGQNAAANSQAKQSGSSTPTQSTTGTAANVKNGATQSPTPTGPSFIEALAQSQADAADSSSAATTVTANASPEDVLGGKGKATKNADTDPTAASFPFLSQSLVAAVAGGQQPSAVEQAPATGDSTDGVSLASGSTIQSLVANLTNGSAEALPGATTGAGDDKAVASATTGSGAADGTASGPSAFQAQMGVSSHFQTNATANTQTTNDKVTSPVGSTAFNEEVGGKVTWMASQKLQSASLQVTPEHMGPVEVRISMQDGTTSVAFSANHADTRAALEQALPRLREMFATQGLTLSDASVSQQSPRGQPQKQGVAAIGAVGGAAVEDDSTSSITAVNSARLGLLDTYA